MADVVFYNKMYMSSSLTLYDVVTNSGFIVSIHSNITAVYSSVLYTSATFYYSEIEGEEDSEVISYLIKNVFEIYFDEVWN